MLVLQHHPPSLSDALLSCYGRESLSPCEKVTVVSKLPADEMSSVYPQAAGSDVETLPCENEKFRAMRTFII